MTWILFPLGCRSSCENQLSLFQGLSFALDAFHHMHQSQHAMNSYMREFVCVCETITGCFCSRHVYWSTTMNLGLLHNTSSNGGLLEIDYGRDQRLSKYRVRHKGQFTQIHLAAMKALSMCILNLRAMGILPPSPFMFTTCSWILIHWFVHVSWNWKAVLWTHDDFNWCWNAPVQVWWGNCMF